MSETSGSWIDDFGPREDSAFRAPVSYPSDPAIGPNRILLADYSHPGAAIITTRTGRVLGTPRGRVRELTIFARDAVGAGLIAINDDYRDRPW